MASYGFRHAKILSRSLWLRAPRPRSQSSLVRDFSLTAVPVHLERVGFIGLGNMGFHMANNLINAGYKITVHDINIGTMKKFPDKGIPTKETPREVAESSDVILTMLPSSSTVLDVYTGQDGLLRSGNCLSPWLFIDSSTIDPQTSRVLSDKISNFLLKEKKGYAESPIMLDAPVSGGVPAAEAGTPTFMVGGMEEAYVAAKPLFLSMGKNTIYCGGSGNGAAAKLCNNLAMAVSMLRVSEAFALGQNLGIKASTLTKVFNSSSARCWSSGSYNPVPGVMEGVPSSRSYEGGFTSKQMKFHVKMATGKSSGINGRMDLPGVFRCVWEEGINAQFDDLTRTFSVTLLTKCKLFLICVLIAWKGTTGLIWAVTLAGLLAGGALLVYNTSALDLWLSRV